MELNQILGVHEITLIINKMWITDDDLYKIAEIDNDLKLNLLPEDLDISGLYNDEINQIHDELKNKILNQIKTNEINKIIKEIDEQFPLLTTETTNTENETMIKLTGEIDDMEYFLSQLDLKLPETYLFNNEMFINPTEYMKITIYEPEE